MFQKDLELFQERAHVAFYEAELKKSYASYDELDRSFNDSQKTINKLQARISCLQSRMPE